jgi:hypothetical protein
MDWLVRWSMGQKWFRWSSAFSFMIYALHAPLINYLLYPAFHLWSGVALYRLQLYFILPIGVILFCICAGAALRRWMPTLYGILTGGRGFA